MMQPRFLTLLGMAAAAMVCTAVPAQAAIVTIAGPSFDLSYDDALLGPYGTPTIVGNSVFFTTTSLIAQRFTEGTTSLPTLLEGLVITMRGSFAIDSLAVSVLGDYFLEDASASVSVGGLLQARDMAGPAATLTQSALAVDGGTPLNTVGVNSDWRASARLNGSTAVGAGQTNVFLSGARSIGVTLGTELMATLGSGAGLREAFIEQKFSGLQLMVSPTSVPVPGTLALVLAAAAAGALLRLR